MTQKERQERSRREILEAALEEFGILGYEGVTVDSICSRHKISKGMMYHYYSGRDALFLACVGDTFNMLREYAESREEGLWKNGKIKPAEAIREFFMLREYFFDMHPRRKAVFENAMIRPPRHLEEEIGRLRRPVMDMNRRFFERLVPFMELRPGMDKEKALRYLEAIDGMFRALALRYDPEAEKMDLHAMLQSAGELADMALFGVMRQKEEKA